MFKNDSEKCVTYCKDRDIALRFIQRDPGGEPDVMQFVMTVRGRHGVIRARQSFDDSSSIPRGVTWTIENFWVGGEIMHKGGWIEGQPGGHVRILPVRLPRKAQLVALQVLIEALEVYCMNYGTMDDAYYVTRVQVDPGCLSEGIGKAEALSVEEVEEFMPYVQWIPGVKKQLRGHERLARPIKGAWD